MSQMVERVARAIAGMPEDQPLDDRWRRKARAGIAAMREPTEAMMESGMNTGQAPLCHGEIENLWHVLIDEALQ